ncbi:uncharacterized protein PAC_18034 [Phialocephala subalpina]|uniref:NmrA-like domain-containing protein n=1 Tax=Phialocephala subalpina TaxID=576137 RepID=A0A1L7XT11_9HELO|nr:uncharacterized protein PAC_18034 [Phialocephala subalpina]
MMAKTIVIFGATGSQGGSIASELLKASGKYTVLAVTRNKGSDKAKKLAEAGAKLVEADMNDLVPLKKAVKGANVIFAVTDFIGAGSNEKEKQQGINILDSALTTLETLETFIWSNLPDARVQEVPYQNVIHFNSKNDIAKYIKASPLQKVLTEVILGPYYENFVKAPQVYAPQKLSDGTWELILPVNANSKLPFTSVQDLGRLVQVIIEDPEKFRAKTISVVSQKVTPIELLKSWNKAVGLNATFKPLSTEDFQQHLKTVHDFPEVFAVTLTENLSLYRDDPEAWVKGTDFAIQDLVPNLKTWDQYVKEEDWDAFFLNL